MKEKFLRVFEINKLGSKHSQVLREELMIEMAITHVFLKEIKSKSPFPFVSRADFFQLFSFLVIRYKDQTAINELIYALTDEVRSLINLKFATLR